MGIMKGEAVQSIGIMKGNTVIERYQLHSHAGLP